MTMFESSSFSSQQPLPDEDRTVATLRAVSEASRLRVAPLLTEALSDCGCWIRERTGSGSGLALTFELPLREIAELYSSLLECGLGFDRKGHCELAMLCTLSRHAPMHEEMRRHLCLRLEVTFAEEVEPMLAFTPSLHC